jgi:hypothetical protein
MIAYKGTDSGILSYEFNEDGIILKFRDGKKYLYNAEKPGKNHIEKMRALASAGSGLATYVNQHVRGNYARKLQ